MDATSEYDDDPILEMRGVGEEMWADTKADYVRDLRSNWCAEASATNQPPVGSDIP